MSSLLPLELYIAPFSCATDSRGSPNASERISQGSDDAVVALLGVLAGRPVVVVVVRREIEKEVVDDLASHAQIEISPVAAAVAQTREQREARRQAGLRRFEPEEP